MERLIKDGKPILDGTEPLYKKEARVFKKLEEIESLLAKHNIRDLKELEGVLILYSAIRTLCIVEKKLNGESKNKK